jgi:hypothetical protein
VDGQRTILDMFGVTLEYLTEVVRGNPSLRGVIIGYIAERKLWDWFAADGRVSSIRKDDDHDRANKGDLVVTYRGFDFRIEVKSLQTNSIRIFDPSAGTWVKKVVQEAATAPVGGKRQRRKWIESEEYNVIRRKGSATAQYQGAVQCDASDRRKIKLPDGIEVTTTNLQVGEFDILATGLFAFREQWDFGFILNQDLPRSTSPKYPEEVRQRLIKTMIPVAWPLPPDFASDPFILLDRLVAVKGKRRKKS